MTRLFIGRLHYATTAADIEEWLKVWKIDVDRVELVWDPQNRESKRYGFIYVPADQAQRAIALSDKMLHGMRVLIKQPRKKTT